MKLLQNLAAGGQTWAHSGRMVWQVLKIAFSFSFLITFIYVAYEISTLDHFLFQNGYYHLKAEATSYIYLKDVSVSAEFWEKISREKINSKEKIVPTQYLKKITQARTQMLLDAGKKMMSKAIIVAPLAFGLLLLFFLIRGTASRRKHHVSGKKKTHHALLRLKLILGRKASEIKIGSLPLIKGTESQHILVTGGIGSGKTNCFHHILPQVRTKGQKAVIIDTSGAFLERYYNPEKDIILNPFDNRGAAWHPWVECEAHFDYDNISESIIPQTHSDQENYWRTAARSLLSCMLKKLADAKKTSELAHWLLFQPHEILAQFVQGTKAAAHINVNSEKKAASIRSVAASFLGCLEYLKDTSLPFSIKKWIQTEDEDSWLFLCAKPSQRAALSPLLSCWFSTAIQSMLQMPPNLKRRIWFVLDELPVLQKLKGLDSLVTEGSRYGGCALLALQSPSQLEEVYGRAATQTIIGNCATRVIFAEHDPEIAQRISRLLGESEIKEYQEGISYGAHKVRDRVNLSLQTKKRPIVSSTQIQSLKNNQAYIKLSGNTPITKVHLKINASL